MNATQPQIVAPEAVSSVQQPQAIVELTALQLALVGGGTVSVTYL